MHIHAFFVFVWLGKTGLGKRITRHAATSGSFPGKRNKTNNEYEA
jgi:hypothetical protein